MDKHPSKTCVALLALLVGINLRPIMAALGPLLEWLQQDLGLSSSQIGLLTTLPVAMMGLFALSGPWLLRWLGEVRGIAIGMGLISIACAARYCIDSAALLIASAALGGVGIAMIQSLMPAFLKRSHPHSAAGLMGLFTTGIMAGAAIAAASAAPVTASIGWQRVLAYAAVPALIALFTWLLNAEGRCATATAEGLPWKRPRAWLLLWLFGLSTGAYTLVLAWLPPYYIELGWSAVDAGYMLSALTVTEVMAGFLVSTQIQRVSDRRLPLGLAILLLIAGLSGLLIAPLQLALPTILCLGLGIGALFPLSLIITLEHACTPAKAAALMAFVQGGGYLMAANMPLIAGVLRDHLNSLHWAWALMLLGALLMLGLSRLVQPLEDTLGASNMPKG
jgi:CP family cyanate transporter-like MFS transporter